MQNGDFQAIRERVLGEPDYVNSRDYIGRTPLLTAIGFGNAELVEFLLQHGADPNAPVDDGYTCLLTAAQSDKPNSVDIVEALLRGRADIYKSGINGWTPLHMAANCGNLKKAELLLNAGADVNRQTEIDGGNTPLMEAARGGHASMAQFLLDHGADPSIRNWISEETALELARHIAAGPDQDHYRYLKDHPIQVDVAHMLDDIDLPDESKAAFKKMMADFDMAENYLQRSKEIAESGKHAEVIRILTEHVRAS